MCKPKLGDTVVSYIEGIVTRVEDHWYEITTTEGETWTDEYESSMFKVVNTE